MIWSKAVKDTVGLKKFHSENINNWLWEERADFEIFSSKDKKLINLKAYDNVAFHRVIKDKLVQAGDLEFGKKEQLNYGV